MSEKVYTQEDLDNIVSKSKENLENKYSKTHIPMGEYEALKNENLQFKASAKKNEFKEVFIKNNGNPSAFDDFYGVEKDNISKIADGGTDNYFKEISAKKSFYFNNGNQVQQGQSQLSETEDALIKAALGNGTTNNELFGDTIYSKPGINLFTSKRK